MELVSRTQFNAKRWIADPGPRFLRKLGPGSAQQHFVLQRARETRFCAERRCDRMFDMTDTILDLFPSQSAGKFGRRQKRERGSRLPVTIVTGFLGAGKTTLVRRFLETPEGKAPR